MCFTVENLQFMKKFEKNSIFRISITKSFFGNSSICLYLNDAYIILGFILEVEMPVPTTLDSLIEMRYGKTKLKHIQHSIYTLQLIRIHNSKDCTSHGEWVTTKQACRDRDLCLLSLFFLSVYSSTICIKDFHGKATHRLRNSKDQ